MATKWPPPPFDVALDRMEQHDAWYRGNTDDLRRVYGQSPTTHSHNGVAYSGGVMGLWSRLWYGQTQPEGENRQTIHIPVASDLAQLSADLVFGEAMKIMYPVTKDAQGAEVRVATQEAQDRLDTIMSSDQAHAEYLLAGEYAAAHGGAYLAVTWDAAFADRPWLRAFRADVAIPTFRWGKLWSVTLWTEYPEAEKSYRLLEVHERGRITYQLWVGDKESLREQVDMRTIRATEHIWLLTHQHDEQNPAEQVSMDELRASAVTGSYTSTEGLGDGTNPAFDIVLETGLPDQLTVEYIPNMRPQRDWAKIGQLADLGRSDFDGVEGLFDKIDWLWSSLLNDFAIGRGRITVPASYLRGLGVGQGAVFDTERSVYSELNVAPTETGTKIVATQFLIRVTEHLSAIDALIREVLRAAGYSPSSFGDFTGATNTATEVTDRAQASERTRDRKIMYAKPALAKLARAAMRIDGLVYPGQGGGDYVEPDIMFPPASQRNPSEIAQSVGLLRTALAMSIRQAVREVHPEWDDQQVDAEVEAIQNETSLQDPTTLGAALGQRPGTFEFPPPGGEPDDDELDPPEPLDTTTTERNPR
jgi:hypothetical protein